MLRLPMTSLVLILIAFTGARQVLAQDSGSLGTAVDDSRTHWVAPEPAQVKAAMEQAAHPAKVRLGLRLTPFKKVVTRLRNGTTETRFVPGEALRHTLRARLNEKNHFFVGDWHVETVPVAYIRQTRHYELKLNVYRRYGDFGQLEESVGSVNVSGTLEPQEDNVHVLVGVARQRLRDPFGNPYLDVVAGYQPGEAAHSKLSLGNPAAAAR